ncbi:MAG: hypothetical protein V7L27_33140 [Nostoc sp.]|uniref:hypothetical protein n=1 Tax=Nostoc sp. TaxID=1180 RepID=UPI002FF9CD5A
MATKISVKRFWIYPDHKDTGVDDFGLTTRVEAVPKTFLIQNPKLARSQVCCLI